MEVIQVQGDTIETFVDKVIEKAKEGYSRFDTMELTLALQTNYWVMSMQREDQNVAQELQENTVNTVSVAQGPRKAGRPTKSKE